MNQSSRYVRGGYGVHGRQRTVEYLKLRGELLYLSSVEYPTSLPYLVCAILLLPRHLREQNRHGCLELLSIFHECFHERIVDTAEDWRWLTVRSWFWDHRGKKACHPRCLLPQCPRGVGSVLDSLDDIVHLVRGVEREAQDTYNVCHWRVRAVVMVVVDVGEEG